MNPRSTSKQPSAVLSHWYAVVDDVQFSSHDFYESVLDELAARKLPQLKTSRVEYHEGGVLSDKRVYLRLARERFAFDVCAAPWGTGYFFSLRFIEKPRSWLQFLVFAVLLVILWSVGTSAFYTVRTYFWWVVAIAALILGGYWIIKQQRATAVSPNPITVERAAFPIEIPDFDAYFLNMAVVGDLYERTRKDTYYRTDTRLLYHSVVSDIVKAKVDEFTAAKGVKLLRAFDYNPLLDLYKPAKLKPGSEEEAS